MRLSNSILLAIFSSVIILIWAIGLNYASLTEKENQIESYQKEANTINSRLATLISEKQNANMALAISLASNGNIKPSFKSSPQELKAKLESLSQQLRQKTEFKNVWIQYIDANGLTITSSWTDKANRDLKSVRQDIREMIRSPEVKSSISVGQYDLSFKAMVPFYHESKYAGHLEIITHFNSIAKKIQKDGFSPVFLVTEKQSKKLKYPFTGLFVNDRYIANTNADPDIIDLINQHRSNYFKERNGNYFVDEENRLLITKGAIWQSNKLLADVLMFKPLDNIQKVDTNPYSFTILVLLISTLILAFIFYFLAHKEQKLHITTDKFAIILIIAFLLLATALYQALEWRHMESTERWLESQQQMDERQFRMIHNNLGTVANSQFNSAINTRSVQQLLSKAIDYPEQKDEARKALFQKLVKDYKYLKSEFNARQLHFHLKNNDSFLRFHRPEKYGDNLTSVRGTVKWVNEKLSPVSGFEEGRIFNGFRNVYPLFCESSEFSRRHIGSVEISFPAFALVDVFLKWQKNAKAAFLVKDSTISRKVWTDERSNYLKSSLEGYSFDKLSLQKLTQHYQNADLSSLPLEDIEALHRKINLGHSFVIPSKDNSTIFTFIPFENPVTQKHNAVFVIQKDGSYLNDALTEFYITFVIGLLGLLIAALYLYKEITSKIHIQQLLDRSQMILDSQNAIVIITTGKRLIDSNHSLLEFYKLPNLETFVKKYECVCNTFVRQSPLFSLDHVKEHESWIDVIYTWPMKDRIVGIKNHDLETRYFSVAITPVNEDYIVTLNDITSNYVEHLAVLDESFHDPLTKALNRKYFYDVLPQKIEQTDKALVVTIFDIDHFKEINDTFGHDAGDDILKEVVHLVQNSIRQEDLLIRWGGEEFLLLMTLDHAVKHNLEETVESLRRKIEAQKNKYQQTITCSFGITLKRNHEDINVTVNRADKALYKAKHEGRNKVVTDW